MSCLPLFKFDSMTGCFSSKPLLKTARSLSYFASMFTSPTRGPKAVSSVSFRITHSINSRRERRREFQFSAVPSNRFLFGENYLCSGETNKQMHTPMYSYLSQSTTHPPYFLIPALGKIRSGLESKRECHTQLTFQPHHTRIHLPRAYKLLAQLYKIRSTPKAASWPCFVVSPSIVKELNRFPQNPNHYTTYL